MLFEMDTDKLKPESKELWGLIVEKADADKAYRAKLDAWMSSFERCFSTVYFRDEIAAPFVNHVFDSAEEWQFDPFFDAWVGIDNYKHHRKLEYLGIEAA